VGPTRCPFCARQHARVSEVAAASSTRVFLVVSYCTSGLQHDDQNQKEYSSKLPRRP